MGITSSTARRVRKGSTLPSTCSVGEVFLKESGGSEGLYICLTANNWILLDAAAGDGTVTSVSVVTANGLSGSVANPTTTPALTLNISGLDAAKIADGSVSNAEFQRLDATSSIQTQLDSKVTNLTGPITSIGNATSVASQTGTGTKFVMDTSPTLVTPTLGVASATSLNLGGTALANYLEGTFTPGISFNGGTTGITYTTQVGSYTRIGDIVTCWIKITLSNKGSSTGTVSITGLPITSGSTTNQNAVASPLMSAATFTGTAYAFIGNGVTTAQIYAINGGTLAQLDDTAFQNTTQIILTISYRAN